MIFTFKVLIVLVSLIVMTVILAPIYIVLDLYDLIRGKYGS
jgi:hypothetical protein